MDALQYTNKNRITSQDTLVGALNRQATELKRLVGTIDTHWECECGEHYVWPKNVWRCATCCFTQDECPDAIEVEVGGFRPTMGEPVFWQQFNKITNRLEVHNVRQDARTMRH